MASYVFCRVCDERHDTYDKALADLAGMVRDERYYTQHETPPKIMRRTPMVGVGARGGRGLFVMGDTAGLSRESLTEESAEQAPNQNHLGGAIYGADYEEVF